MKHKHIEAARELRLWIAQIVIPACGIMMMMPETRNAAVNRFQKAKDFINRKTK